MSCQWRQSELEEGSAALALVPHWKPLVASLQQRLGLSQAQACHQSAHCGQSLGGMHVGASNRCAPTTLLSYAWQTMVEHSIWVEVLCHRQWSTMLQVDTQ